MKKMKISQRLEWDEESPLSRYQERCASFYLEGALEIEFANEKMKTDATTEIERELLMDCGNALEKRVNFRLSLLLISIFNHFNVYHSYYLYTNSRLTLSILRDAPKLHSHSLNSLREAIVVLSTTAPG